MVSIIVPCYNEEKNIPELVKRFRRIKKKYDIELVLVDNGSKDNTREVIKTAMEKADFVRLAVVKENQGYGYGILKGLEAAKGEWMGWMHADLQSDPRVFCRMIESVKVDSANVLYKGKRKGRPVIDTIFTIGMSFFETLYLGEGLWDINAQPTLLKREFYEMWKNPPIDFSLDLYVYYMARKRKIPVKRVVSRQYNRVHGSSTWNTGMKSRIKLVKRVLSYSKQLKKQI